MLGWDSFDPDSAWWTFEQVQRLVAPREPDLELWQATWPHVRARWDQVERREFVETAWVEKVAMKLWEYGKTDLACEVLTKYTYTQLHSNFLRARALLNWVLAQDFEKKKGEFTNEIPFMAMVVL
jgi:dipeptidase